MAGKVIIFDTTLRDGEQAPGASMNTEEKIRIAQRLVRLNVDVIEAGFPIASPDDWSAVNAIARRVKGPVIAGLARANEKDINSAGKALKPARRRRIHTFIATSEIHLKYKLEMSREDVLAMAVKAVKRARRFTDDVEFSPEDAARTERDYLCRVVEAVIKAGAKTVNIPDTVGYSIPGEFGEIIAEVMNCVPNVDKAVISVHCHNDLGLATANSLAAVISGARQVECTINGMGERAGNASLEEVVMSLRTRRDLFKCTCGVKTAEIYKTSKLVSDITGWDIPRNKAVVGANAFAHEAGIHQHGMIKERTTYEIMTPQSVGWPESRLVLGKHSGRHAVKKRLEALGIKLNREDLNKAFERFKELADKKKEVFDEDLEVIAISEVRHRLRTYQLVYLHAVGGRRTVPTATVRLKVKGIEKQEAACGDGPVDAAYNAVDRISGIKPLLEEYKLKAITRGRDALGEVYVSVRIGNVRLIGRGSSTDIIEASLLAYLDAMNQYQAEGVNRGRKKRDSM